MDHSVFPDGRRGVTVVARGVDVAGFRVLVFPIDGKENVANARGSHQASMITISNFPLAYYQVTNVFRVGL